MLETLVQDLEQQGVTFRVAGEDVRLIAPAGRVPAADVIERLRCEKVALLACLRARQSSQESPVAIPQLSSISDPRSRKTENLHASPFSARDSYASRMLRVWDCLCRPAYPAGMVPWLSGHSPALYSELTSRLPNRIQRLWESRAPLADFDSACKELEECHWSAVVLFRKHGPGWGGDLGA